MTQTLNLGNIISPNGASVIYTLDGKNQYTPYTIEFTNEPEEVLRADGIKYKTESEDTNNTDTTTVREVLDSKQDKIRGNIGQFVVIGNDGYVTTKTILVAEEASF